MLEWLSFCPRGLFPNLSRAGIRNFAFEACPSFTRVTARWITQLTKAAFARLQPSRLHGPAGCQRQIKPTSIRLECSALVIRAAGHWQIRAEQAAMVDVAQG